MIERKGSNEGRQGHSERKAVVEAAARIDFCFVVGGAILVVGADVGVEGRIRLVSSTVKN